MYSVKITAAEKLFVQSDGTEILAVDFDLLKDDEIVSHYSHGFDLATTQDEITAYFQAYCENCKNNADLAEKNADRDAAHKVADKTIEGIVGVEIKN